jgi:hypothetical protein
MLTTYFYGTDQTYTRQRVDIPEDGKILRVGGAPNGIWPVVVSGFVDACVGDNSLAFPQRDYGPLVDGPPFIN